MAQARFPFSLTTPMLGGLLLLAGLALNPWSLGRLLSPDGQVDNTDFRGMILAAEALLVAAGLVVVRMRPRTAPLPIAVLLALPLLAAAGLGAYGGALALLPPSQEQKTMASMERSEVLYLAVTPTLRALGQSAQNLAFPDPGSHSLFADQVVVASDLDEAPRVEGRLDEAVLSRWPIADGSRSVPKADLALWRPFFSTVEYFSHAKFYIVNARFVDQPETRWETQIHFKALARLASGALAQVDADMDALWVRDPAAPQAEPASWRIAELRTKEFELAEAARPYFDDVAEQVLRDPADRDRARTSMYDRLRVEYFKNKTKPHEFFGHHVAERHSGLAVVDIDADGLDDLYLMDEFGKNMLLRNLGDGGFRDVAADYGLDIDGLSSSGIFADFDNDGDPDLVPGPHAPSLRCTSSTRAGVLSTVRPTLSVGRSPASSARCPPPTTTRTACSTSISRPMGPTPCSGTPRPPSGSSRRSRRPSSAAGSRPNRTGCRTAWVRPTCSSAMPARAASSSLPCRGRSRSGATPSRPRGGTTTATATWTSSR